MLKKPFNRHHWVWAGAVVASLVGVTVPLQAGPPLDPQMQKVIDEQDRLKPRPLTSLTPAQARKEPGSKDAAKSLERRLTGKITYEPIAGVSNRTVPGPAGPRVVRVYKPLESRTATEPLPVLVFVHGGGWSVGSIAGYEASCRALANRAGCVVISVSYRLAPENPFPAGHEDVYAALQYIMKNAAQFGGDPKRVAIGGESAGGNITAGVCLMVRDRKGLMPVHQLLIYPTTDTRTNTPSYQKYAYAKPLDRAQMRWFIRNVAPTARQRNSPYLAPLRSPSLKNLPPATVIVAEVDPMQSEARAYAERLSAFGVPVRYRFYKGLTHEFFSMGQVVERAKDANQFAADGLKKAFSK